MNIRFYKLLAWIQILTLVFPMGRLSSSSIAYAAPSGLPSGIPNGTPTGCPSVSPSTNPSTIPQGCRWQSCDSACTTYFADKNSTLATACPSPTPGASPAPIVNGGVSYENYDRCVEGVSALLAKNSGTLGAFCESKKLVEETMNWEMYSAVAYTGAFASCTASCLGLAVLGGDALCTAADLTAAALDIVASVKISKAGETAADLANHSLVEFNAKAADGSAAALGLAGGIAAGVNTAVKGTVYNTAYNKMAEGLGKKTTEEIAKEKAKKIAKEAARAAKVKSGQMTAEMAAKEAAEELATELAAKKATENTAKEAGERAGKEAVEGMATNGEVAGRNIDAVACGVAAYIGALLTLKWLQYGKYMPELKEHQCSEIQKLRAIGAGSVALPQNPGRGPSLATSGDTSGSQQVGSTTTGPNPSATSSDSSQMPSPERLAAMAASDPAAKPLKDDLAKMLDGKDDLLKKLHDSLAGGATPAQAMAQAVPELPSQATALLDKLAEMGEKGLLQIEGTSSMYSGGGSMGPAKKGSESKNPFDFLSSRMERAQQAAKEMTFNYTPKRSNTDLSLGTDIWHSKWKGSIFQIVSTRLGQGIISDKDRVAQLEWATPLNRALVGLPKLAAPAPVPRTPAGKNSGN